MKSQQQSTMVRIMHPENAGQSIAVPKIGPHGHSQEVRFNAQGVAVVPVDPVHIVDGALPILKVLGWRHELLTSGAADPADAPSTTRPATAADMQEEVNNLLQEIDNRDQRLMTAMTENDRLRSDLAYAEGKLGELANLDKTEAGQSLRQQLNQMATEREELNRTNEMQAQVIRQAAEALGWSEETHVKRPANLSGLWSPTHPLAYLNGHVEQIVQGRVDEAVAAERQRGEKLLAEATAKAKAAPVVQPPANGSKK